MISIITPTYNESKNIVKLVQEVDRAMKGIDYELIVSDDNSPDGTSKIVRRLAKHYPVNLILRKEDKGLSPAVCEGFRKARGDIIGVIDADLSHPPEIIPQMIKHMRKENADMVVASRLVNGGGTEGWPASRRLTSYIATSLAKPITDVKDPMSGFFFLRKDVIDKVDIKTKGYKILLEILAKGNYDKVVEFPFTFRDRTAGQSKLTAKIQAQYLMQLRDLYMYKLYNSGFAQKIRNISLQ